jgi:outer membrane protein
MKKVFLLFLILISAGYSGSAQTIFTADSAAAIALKNNFDIRIARTVADINKRNNTAGNAGMLPGVGITGSEDYSTGHVNQNLFDGTSTNVSNANSNSLSAGIALNWTLFNGGKMFITKKKLNEIETLGQTQFQDQVMQTLFLVYSAYYDVVRQKEQLKSIQKVIQFNQERVTILSASFNAGLAPKTDLLQARIDLNVYKENAISQEVVITTAKRLLNKLLSRDPDYPFEVDDTIVENYQPDRKDLLQKLFSVNPSVQSSKISVEVSRLGVNEMRSSYFPSVNFNAGYDLLHSDNNTGTVRMNESYGPMIGATLSIPLYQAGNVRRQVSVARLAYDAAQYALENTKFSVNTEFQIALTGFDNQIRLLKIETDNFALAKENLDISLQRLRLGQTTALEVRQAQESFQESMTRLTDFGYLAKVAEIKLKQLMGNL